MKIRIFDKLSGCTGYSRNISGLATALYKMGIDVQVIENPTSDYIPEEAKPFVRFDVQNAVKEIDSETIVMGRTYADIHVLAQFNPKVICAIAVLEGDKMPQDWVYKGNYVDMIWASSTYNKAMLEKNGLACDIPVIWHGFDEKKFWIKWYGKCAFCDCNNHSAGNHGTMCDNCIHAGDYFLNDFKWWSKLRPIRFLFVGGCVCHSDRKGAQYLAEAFNVFNENDNVELVFKINTSYNPEFDAEAHLRSLIKPELQSKVSFITKFMTDEELAELYRSCDVSVTPSSGEAFCMSILESLACGTPCIVTNHSGYLDYCNNENGWLIDVEKRVIASYGIFDIPAGSVWVKPSVSHLSQLLKHVYENPAEVEQKGRKAAEVHNWLKWSDMAKRTVEILENYITSEH